MLHNESKPMRAISIALALIFMLVSVLSSAETVNAASKLKVTVSKKTIYVGQTAKLKANKSVKWSVSKKKVAKLTKVRKKTATVKGLKPGTVYVKAKAGKKIKKIKIVVKRKGPNKLYLSASQNVIGKGEYCSIFVKSDKKTDAIKDVKLSSSNSSVATVNSRGLVTGVKEGSVTITAKSKSDKTVKAKIKIEVVKARSGVLSVTIDMSNDKKYPAGKAVKAWFQVPVSDYNQTIGTPVFESKLANSKKMRNMIVPDSSGAKAYYIEWGSDVAPEDRKATLSFHIYRREVLHSEDLKSNKTKKVNVSDKKLAMWVKQTKFSGSLKSGVVKSTADKIVKKAGAETVYDKAHAIYLWVCDNISRDKSMPDRELGDVVKILSSKDKVAGSCIDINSIFVALCNAEGIPARESFGFKISEDQDALGQNCRAEFYLPGDGWIEVDPAMPLGLVMRGLVNKEDTAVWETIKDTYWTSGSADWICQNHGRDLTFEAPAALNVTPGYMINSDGTLNHFMFPHGEYDGQYIPGWGNYSSEFIYEYTYTEDKAADCGC